jgi:hypothetical protein
MGEFKSHGILVLATLVLSMVLQDQSSVLISGWDAKKIIVHISNNLFPSGSVITVHCKSRDDDLGVHEVIYLDYYEFSFRNNWQDSTLFFCHFEWLNYTMAQTVSDTFDIYKGQRDEKRCDKVCQWRIQEEGLFSYDDKNEFWDGLYTWSTHK